MKQNWQNGDIPILTQERRIDYFFKG